MVAKTGIKRRKRAKNQEEINFFKKVKKVVDK